MRILSYNIFNCFESTGGSARLLEACVRLVPEVLLLNEYRVNAEGQRLRAELEQAGYVHHEVGRSVGNRDVVAVFSRGPFCTVANSERVRMVAVELGGVRLVAYHASPRGVASVLAELPDVEAVARGHDEVVLAGDLNSLAAGDAWALGCGGDMMHMERYQLDGRLNFKVVAQIEAWGMKDLGGRVHTVPTRLGRKAEAGRLLRLDYAFARGVRVEAWRARVLHGEPFDTMSDHYPVLIEGTDTF